MGSKLGITLLMGITVLTVVSKRVITWGNNEISFLCSFSFQEFEIPMKEMDLKI